MSSLVIWRGISPSRDLEISSTVSSTGRFCASMSFKHGQIDVFVDSERFEIVFGKIRINQFEVIKDIHRIVADNLDLLPVALYINDVYPARRCSEWLGLFPSVISSPALPSSIVFFPSAVSTSTERFSARV